MVGEQEDGRVLSNSDRQNLFKLDKKRPQIAVVGMACRFPDALDYRQFWENLVGGRSSIRRVPAERWSDLDEIRSTEKGALIPWCGMLDDIEIFDHEFFNISAREARSMDPQQRLLLQESWHCLEDAGVTLKELRGHATGVWAGVMANDYHQAAVAPDVEVDSYAALGSYDCILANRISYNFGLSGPSLSVGAACASSNVALHLAKQSLQTGECQYAFVAGVSLNFHSWKNTSFGRSRMLSPDGRCKTFDQSANGYVPGEGIAVLLLQPLEDALKAGHPIHGLIAGTAVNHTGAGPMITAPRVEAQAEVVRAALADAGIGPEAISYIEAHGTGTSLGDPIEVAGLQSAFRSAVIPARSCHIGSVKTNIGHLEAAAGLAGVIKTLLMMRHGVIVPTLNIETSNGLIDFAGSPFVPATEAVTWSSSEVRRAGVSSFGFGGANSHVILEDFVPTEAVDAEVLAQNSMPFVLSAKSPQSLLDLREQWRRLIESGAFDADNLSSVCRTLLLGRESLPIRCGGMVADWNDIPRLLGAAESTSSNDAIEWSLIFGVFGFNSHEAVGRYFSAVPGFIERVSQILMLMEAAGEKDLVAEFQNESWGAENRVFFAASIAMATVDLLAESGVTVTEVSHDGRAMYPALAASGCWSVDELVAAIRSGHSVVTQRPRITYLDPMSGKRLTPVEVHEDYFLRLASFNPETSGLRTLLDTGRQLLSHQFTFKKYFEEWSERSASFDIDLPALLEDASSAVPIEKRVLAVACFHCLSRLREKWHLPESELVISAELREIAALLAGGLLEIDAAIRMLMGRADLGALTEMVNQQLPAFKRGESLALLAGMSPVPRFEVMAGESPVGLVDQVNQSRVIGFGRLAESVPPNVGFDLADVPASSLMESFLRLWLCGAPIDWQRLFPAGTYTKQRLPGYPFGGKPFWLKKRAHTARVDGAAKEPAVEPKTVDGLQWSFSVREPLVEDHLIGNQYLLPAAAMVDLGLVAVGTTDDERFYRVDDFRVLEPCVVRDACVVKGRIAGETFELLEGERAVAKGRFSTTSEEPSQESIPSFALDESRPSAQIYSELAALGYHYGPSLRPLLRVSNREPFWATLGAGPEDWSDGHRLSPRLLDGVFQAGLLAVMRRGATVSPGSLWVPCGFASSRIRAGIHGPVYVRETAHYVLPNGDAIVSLVGVSDKGEVQLEVKDLILKVVPIGFGKPAQVADAGLRFVPQWSACEVQTKGAVAEKSFVVFGHDGAGAEFDEIHAEVVRVDYRCSGDWSKLFQETLREHGDLYRIYWIAPRFTHPNDGAQLANLIGAHVEPFFEACQVLAAQEGRSFELVVLTEGCVGIGEEEVVVLPLHALLFGLAKTLSREHGSCRILCADLENGLPAHQRSALAVVTEFGAIGERCWRGQVEFRKEIKPDVGQPVSVAPFQQGDVFLIAGGLGGVGRELVRFLHRKYAGRLVLLGRSRPSKAQAGFLEQLRRDGTEVRYLRCDLANEVAVREAVSETVRDLGRIDGIFHVAGSLMDSQLLNMSASHFREGIRAKVDGVFNLYRATTHLSQPVRAFVQFSSVLTLEGNPGQSSYVASCCFQDHFAAYLRGCQMPAQVINWGRWEEAGSVARDYHRRHLDDLGILGMKSADALEALDHVLEGNLKQVIVARLAEWKQQEWVTMEGVKPVAEAPLAIKSRPMEKRSEVAQPSDRQRAKVLGVLQACVADVLESEVEDGDLALRDQGVDSIIGVEFVTAVNKALDIGLNATVLYDHPSLNRLAEHIMQAYDVGQTEAGSDGVCQSVNSASIKTSSLAEVFDDSVDTVDTVSEAEVGSSQLPLPANDDIAIIGMSARYPDADSIDEFWENLRSGKKCIREVPADHWGASWFNADAEAKNRSVCKWGGFIRNSDRFDSLFFNISPADAAWMDPQQRIVLQECWRAFENAGYTPEMLSESRCGAMIGVMSNDYQEMISSDPDRTLHAAELVGNSNAILSARISYALNLRGPSMAIDTACSSSLVALHYASNALRMGEAEMMLVGGVTLYRSPMYYVRMSKAGMLSPTGRCWTFDDRADGYVPGEGCGVVVLKRVGDALRDGDHIHAVIKGSALNQDGKTNGITAPSSESQKALLLDVYRRHGIDPESLGLLEAHGTGTKLGDPIEFNALTQAFRQFTSSQEYCAIGSVKANIGHTLAAAGLAGVIKAVLSLQNRQRVPLISYGTLNGHISAAGSPFYIPTELQDWPQRNGSPRRAGVSSFGFSGTNAHVILEEAPPRVPDQEGAGQPVLLVLSARDEDVLSRKVSDLRSWWSRHGDNYSLSALASTLLYRRSHYACRLAFVVSDREGLRDQLTRFDGAVLRDTEFFSEVRGKVAEKQAALGEIAATLQDQLRERSDFSSDERVAKLGALAELYRQGLDLREPAAESRQFPVVPLPGYPFIGRSFDLPVDVERTPVESGAGEALRGLFFHHPIWEPAPLVNSAGPMSSPVLVVNAPAAIQISGTRELSFLDWDVTEMPATESVAEQLRANDAFQRYLAGLRSVEGNPAEIIIYGNASPRQRMLHSMGSFLQALSRSLDRRPVRILYAYALSDDLASAEHAAVSGLARTVRHELPQIQLKVVSFSGALPDVDKTMTELRAAPFVGELRCDDRSRELRRFARLSAADWGEALPDYGNSVVLITGGLGGLGFMLARLLGQRGAKLVLTGRREADGSVTRRVDELNELAGDACYVACDLSDEASVRGLVAQVQERFGRLDGVIHCAGVNRDSLLLKKSGEEIDAVFAAKVSGLLHLDRATSSLPLRFFVLFSSISATTGNFGQADYATGNAFMDAFAQWRQQQTQRGGRQGSTVSINWPYWEGGGMRLGEQEIQWLHAQLGLVPITEAQGLGAFDAIVASGLTQVVVSAGDLERIEKHLNVAVPAAMPSDAAQSIRVGKRAQEPSAKLERPSSEAITEQVKGVLVEVLKVAASDVDEDTEFELYGIDSISMIGILREIESRFSISLHPVALQEHPTVRALVSHLSELLPEESLAVDGAVPEAISPGEHGNGVLAELPQSRPVTGGDLGSKTVMCHAEGSEEPAFVQAGTKPAKRSLIGSEIDPDPDDDAIAVIGMSCRFPGADTVDEYWENLIQGKASIEEIPSDRWDADSFYDPASEQTGKSRSKWGGFIGDVTQFDAAFYKIKDNDAVAMDPQQRILLELCQHLIDQAGYSAEEISGTRTAVIVGATESPYVKRSWQRFDAEQLRHVIAGTIQNMLAARISDFYNLDGLAQVIDTACSSSLVAIHQGCELLRTGAADGAICGGIELLLDPFLHVGFSQSGVLSPTDRCHVFDEQAKGIVLGEGGGLVMLKRLKDARAAGDRIMAVVRGSAVNNDGRTVGLTVPNPVKQKAVIEQALADAKVSGDEITYLEAHGTGTLLGDPIEIQAATQAYRNDTQATAYCGVGSVKSNIGHLLHAAGIAGFIKVVQGLQHQQIPATLHCTTPHPRFRFDQTPFYPVQGAQFWEPRHGRRLAGISSLGFGGCNCHMILEEAAGIPQGQRPIRPLTAFQRQPYWLVDKEQMLGLATSSLAPSGWRERFLYDEPYIRDHEVHGKRIVLGMTHLAMAVRRELEGQPLKRFLLLRPLEVSSEQELQIDYCHEEGDQGTKFVCRFGGSGTPEDVATGLYSEELKATPAGIDLTLHRERAGDVAALYARLSKSGIFHGASLRTIVELLRSDEGVLARLEVRPELRGGRFENLAVHPALLDGAIASCLTALDSENSFIPLSVRSLTHFGVLPFRCYSLARGIRLGRGFFEADISFYDDAGKCLLVMEGLTCKSISNSTISQPIDVPLHGGTRLREKALANDGNEAIANATSYLSSRLTPLLPGGINEIDPNRNFLDLGISSNDLVLAAADMASELGVELYPTIFFEHANLASLVQYFEEQFAAELKVFIGEKVGFSTSDPAAENPESPVASAVAFAPNPAPTSTINGGESQGKKDIAIIGMAGQFAQSKDLDEFWQNLRDGKDLITEIPTDHFDFRPWYDQKGVRSDSLYCKWGSFISDVASFDADFFNISPREAAVMDPQLRLLLQVMYRTAEDAGCPGSIRGSNTGVFTGVCFHDFHQELDRRGKAVNPHDGTGTAATMLANRPSFYFNLKGPSLAVDTACSSSLVAIHQACRALQNGECETSFAAGVNLLLSSWHYRYFCSIGALSHTGRCHTFDAAADGYVPGEGIAAVLLKPLDRALADGDPIQAIIKGSAVNHGGYTPSITAPSVEMEAAVLRKAWQDAGIDPATIGYIEAHGTGTKLGDPIEIEGLKQAFKATAWEEGSCAIGSAKAHIGHTEGAAGIAGVIKAVLSLKHREIPAMPGFKEQNPYVNLSASPLRINRELEAWPRPGEGGRRAGVSSFGFGGTYSHVVLEEAPDREHSVSRPQTDEVIVFSAAQAEQLPELAQSLLDAIEDNSLALADVAYTLQMGREHRECRYGVIVKSIEELRAALQMFVAADPSSGGAAKRNEMTTLSREELETACQERVLEVVLEAWLAGQVLPWNEFSRDETCRVVSLPGYPFLTERHWPEDEPENPVRTEGRLAAVETDFAAPGNPLERVNELAGELAAVALKGLGLPASFDDSDAVLEQLRIPASQGPLARELIELLTRRGFLLKDGSRRRTTERFNQSDDQRADRLSEELLAEISDYRAYVLLTQRCGRHLPQILSGEMTATDLLFTDGASEWVKGIYTENPIADRCHQALSEMVLQGVRTRAQGPDSSKRLRVLEIGAGTGATTEAVCARLGDLCDSVGYVFSDIATTFVKQARQRWESRGFMEFIQLDIEEDLDPSLGQFDFIIAANVLHAVEDLGAALERIYRLLAPGGAVLINEAIRKQDFLTVTFGTLSGWWRFGDSVERLSGSPLLSVSSWQSVLNDVGLRDAKVLESGVAYDGDTAQEVVFAAKAVVEASSSSPSIEPQPGVAGVDVVADVRAWLTESIAKALGTSQQRVSGKRVFSEMGVDSIVAIEFVQTINSKFGLKLKTNLIFDHPTVESLAGYLIEECPAVRSHFADQASSASRAPERATVSEITSVPTEQPVERPTSYVAAGAQCRAVLINGPLSIDALSLQAMTVPRCGPEQVLVNVEASALNFGDLLCVKGMYPTMPAYPFVPGFEFSGVVQECGSEVEEVCVGDAVFGLTPNSMGGHGQRVVTDANLILSKPIALSHEEATTLPVSWCIARHCFRLADPLEGETVVVQASAGGNGSMAIRLAKGCGCRVIAVTGDGSKEKYLRELGADDVVSHRASDPVVQIRNLVGDLGVDVVWNVMTGSMRTAFIELLGPGGRFLDLAVAGPEESLGWNSLGKNRTVFSVDIRDVMTSQRRVVESYLNELRIGLQTGDVEPLAHRVFAFDQAPAAFRYFDSGQHVGKVVINGMAPEADGPARLEIGRKNDSAEADVIAVVGMSGCFPGARNLNEFWRNLVSGKDCITEIPRERWDIDAFYDSDRMAPDRTYCRRGGFLDDIDLFDPVFFNMTGKEAEFCDPQQRLFLRECWNALEDAGMAGEAGEELQCGVFVGASPGDYFYLQQELGIERASQSFWGNDSSILASRIAYFMNLKGPSIAVNTACSSSLVAMHLACQSLLNGETELALAGGAFVCTTPTFHILCSKAGMLSPEGKCKAFDASADGFVPGEGVGVVVLKRYRDALADGDQIIGLIRGSGINQDGRTNGITAPSARSQTALEGQVYAKAGISPETISYVEAHGTGTKLGDPIEIEALTSAFRKQSDKRQFCALGSVKTNIGHAAAAAGIAGVLKVLLAIRHGQLPPSLHFHEQNNQIDFSETPFFLNKTLREWVPSAGHPQRAAVSSFGFSGTNAHVVLEAPAKSVRRKRSSHPQLVVVSAPSEVQLKQSIQRVKACLASNRALRLDDVSFTLLTGRRHFQYRCAWVASSLDNLVEQLEASLPARVDSQDSDAFEAAFARLRGSKSSERSLKDLSELARGFMSGLDACWDELYNPRSVTKCSLPTLPFKESSFWLSERAPVDRRGSGGEHQDTGVRQETLTTAGLPFRDHVVGGRTLLPGAWIVQTAFASGMRQGAGVKDVRFLQALSARDETVMTRLESGDDGHFEYSSEGIVLATGQIVDAPPMKNGPFQSRMPSPVTKELDSGAFYQHLRRRGYDYGESLRLVANFSGNGKEALATLHARGAALYQIIDAAIQVAVVLDGSEDQLLLAAIGEVTLRDEFLSLIAEDVSHRGGRLTVYVQRLTDDHTGRRFDVQVLLPDGRLGLSLSAVSGHPTRSDKNEGTFFVPRWSPCPMPNGYADVDAAMVDATMVFYPKSSAELARRLSNVIAGGAVLVPMGESPIGLDSERQSFEASLQRVSGVLNTSERESRIRVVFVGIVPETHVSPDTVLASQRSGVISLYRLLRWFQQGEKSYQLKQLVVLTNRIHRVHDDDEVMPLGAELHGMAINAMRELPGLQSLVIDLDGEADEEWLRRNETLVGGLLNASSKGELALRNGTVYRRELCPLRLPSNLPGAFKRDGVYVILGGAGGIGLALCEYLLREYDARVLLVGRSELNESVADELQRLAGLGGEVAYASGDAASVDSLKAALLVGKKRFGRIDGALHSALVLADRTLQMMDERTLQAVLDPKTIGCVNFVDALVEEDLDFLAFFSSMLSFTSNAGQSNYAAACRFEDAFGLFLQRRASCPVTVINWGYWSEIGIVSDERYARMLAERGILGLKTEEGIMAMERVLSAGVDQVLVLRAEAAFLKELGVTGDPIELLVAGPKSHRGAQTRPTHLRRLVTPMNVSEGFESAYAAADRFAMAALAKAPQISTADVQPQYQQLFEVIDSARNGAAGQWDGNASVSLQGTIREYPEMTAYLTLLERCLQALPDVLTGKQCATDIIFPNASLDLVTGIYASNRIADYFNEKLAKAVCEIVKDKQGDSSEPILIIEIGAGTGGTTGAVLNAVEPMGQRVEYVYTDVSKHFLDHGARHFKASCDLSFQLLDIENSQETVAIRSGGYDVVIASNVLHATSDIKRTLENVKSLLRRGGVAVINEVSSVRLITSLTFGLLPGWWRFSDPERRLPQSPLLSPALWLQVFESVGFENVGRLGQEGEGTPVVQDIYFATRTDAPGENSRVAEVAAERSEPIAAPSEALPAGNLEALEAMVIDSLVESLRLDRDVFDRRLPFAEFGIDSITAVEVINSLNARCGTSLRSTDIFNYPDIPTMAGRLAELNVKLPSLVPEQPEDLDGEGSDEEDPLLVGLNRLAAGDTTVAEMERLLEGMTR